MATESVAAEKDDIDREDNCSYADAKSVREPHRLPNVVRKETEGRAIRRDPPCTDGASQRGVGA